MTQIAMQFETYLNQTASAFEKELCEWLSMPSISTDSAYANEVQRAGQWLADKFQTMGFQSELIKTNRHPIVFAESPPVPDAPVVLVYGHYDVQPPDPLDEWITPPFEPTIRDGKIFARGATDDKGQLFTHVCSAQTWMENNGHLPIQLKFLIEGEEECGSNSLNEFLDGQYDGDGPSVNDRLQADICVISDNSQYAPGQPAVTYGLRGIAYFELNVFGPSQDLHSGAFGGAVTNPANALCQMLSALKDDDGRILIPGFYDDVIELDAREREEYAKLDFNDDEFMKSLGVDGVTGEKGYTTLERRWARPTFDINGLWSGYQGEGAKTVLPAKAGAKFSFRLAPKQDPHKIREALEQMLETLCPPGIRFELSKVHGAPGVVVPVESPYMGAAGIAIEKGFGTTPVFIRSGGSIPIVGTLKERLGIDTLMLGWGQDDDNLHSPNEKFSVEDFHRGILSSTYLWEEIAKVNVG